MADFDVNTITAAGATLIASATAGNKLVIDGCDATTDVLTKAQAVQVSTRPATPGSNTTEVALAGSTDNHVYAYAEFIRGQSTGGDFNTFYLYGHIQNTPSVVRVIAIASASSPTHLPVSGDVTNRTELQFELTFSATDEVVTVADSSMYTTRGEFLLLKERTVTTHAEGTPTTGEAQTIYGAKTFKNAIVCDGSVTFNDDINIGDSATLKTRNIEPTWGSPDIGTSSSHYGKIYCESSYCNEIYSTDGLATGLHNSLACSSGVWIGTGAGPAANVQTLKVSVVNPSYYSDTVEITYYEDASEAGHFCFNAGLVPSESVTYDLGDSTHLWDDIYADCLKLPNVDLYYGNDTDALTINHNIAPEDDESYTLGTPDYKWSNVWAKLLHGVIPHPDLLNTDPPLGCILWIAVYSTTIPFSIGFGELVHGHVGSNRRIYVAEWDASSNEFFSYGTELNVGFEFRSLCRATPNSNNYCFLMAIRTV